MHFFHTILEEPLKTPKSQSCFLLLSPPLAGDDGSRDCSTAYFLMMSLHACVTISLLCRIPPYKLFIITAGWFPLNLLLVMVHTNEPRRRPSSPTTTTTLGTMYSSHHQIKSTGSNHFTNQGGHQRGSWGRQGKPKSLKPISRLQKTDGLKAHKSKGQKAQKTKGLKAQKPDFPNA